jgi:hypothetical protein
MKTIHVSRTNLKSAFKKIDLADATLECFDIEIDDKTEKLIVRFGNRYWETKIIHIEKKLDESRY